MKDLLSPSAGGNLRRPSHLGQSSRSAQNGPAGRWKQRLREVPWGRVGIGTAVAAVLIAVVPPFRNAFATVTSRAILIVASPFAPSIKGFDALPEASRVYAADGTQIGTVAAEQRVPVKLADLPPHVPKAVLAAEDAHFYRHSGVDPAAVFRAVGRTLFRGSSQGGSTITQQLAKLNYTDGQRTYGRKFKELLYASRLEDHYSKDELLERYLNQVYFGGGAYGIGAAAHRFFGVEPQALTPAQAAMLAGKIQAPSAYDPSTKPDAVKARRDHVLAAMQSHGWLSRDELAAAVGSPLGVINADNGPTTQSQGLAPHFMAYVAREAAGLPDLGGTAEERRQRVLTGGYDIHTTLDVKAYNAAVAAVQNTLGAAGDPTTAIASVQPGDGAIRVLFGGLDPNLQFDPASQGRRQPGSSFKPYVYLAMLRAGIDPATTFDSSSPQTVQCNRAPWTVRNYEGAGGGPLSVDDATAESVNVVFAQVMARVGPTAVADVAQSAGIDKADVTPPQCAMALGGLRQGVSPLEQASAFATFAAKGEYAKPYAITKVSDRTGKTLYDRSGPDTSRAFKDKEVGVLTAALEGVVDHGTGTAAAIGRPLAGKTGTTENYGNAWFIGYVPQLATAVWVGYPEGDRPMTNVHGRSVTGGSFPALTFSRYMRAALAGTPVQDLYTATFAELGVRSAVTPSSASPPTTEAASTLPSTTVRSLPQPTIAPRSTSTLAPATTRPSPTTTPTTPAPPPTTGAPPTTAPPNQSPTTSRGGPKGEAAPGPG